MPEWHFSEAHRQFGIEGVAETFAGEVNDYVGNAALKMRLATSAARDVEELADGQPGEAFNALLEGWPSEMRGLVAAILYERGNIESGTFNNEAQFLGRITGWVDGDGSFDEPEDYVNDLRYAANPFNDDELSTAQAETLTELRATGIDEANLDLDAIENVEDFMWWYERTGDAELAQQIHPFGRDANEDLLEHAYPADEWYELDWSSIDDRQCYLCSTHSWLIETPLAEQGRTAWVTPDGDVGGHELDSADGLFMAPDADGGFLCQGCADSWDEYNISSAAAIDDAGDGFTMSIVSSIARFDEDAETFDDDFVEQAVRVATNFSNVRDWYSAEVDSDHQSALRDMVHENSSLSLGESGPFIIVVDGVGGVRIRFPADHPEAVRSAKRLANETEEVTINV